MSEDIGKTLDKRNSTHGDYVKQCWITNEIKHVIRQGKNYDGLSPYAMEALDMIAVKIGRIMEGNPLEPDHWHDIAGYATLTERELLKDD